MAVCDQIQMGSNYPTKFQQNRSVERIHFFHQCFKADSVHYLSRLPAFWYGMVKNRIREALGKVANKNDKKGNPFKKNLNL